MGILNKSLDLVMIYKFLRGLTTPFDKTKAFDLGIIDETGKVLKKRKELKTQEEKDAYLLFDRVIWKLKRLLEKVPFGKTKLATYGTALWFLKEDERQAAITALQRYTRLDLTITETTNKPLPSGKYQIRETVRDLQDGVKAERGSFVGIDENAVDTILGIRFYTALGKDGHMFPVPETHLKLIEEAPVNLSGGGAIAGLGVGAQGEPGKFAGCIVFKVGSDAFHNCIRGKHPRHRYNKYVGEDDVGEEIRQYGRKNPGRGIIVQNAFSGEMVYLRRKNVNGS